jgi:hypothetical protein
LDAPANSKASKELVTKRLSLSNGTETPVVNFLSIELDTILGKLETFLDNGSELPDPPSLLT